MKRREWQFEYGVEEVMEAAKSRATYHRDRVGHWILQREAAMGAIRESGVDIREHEVTGGVRADVVVDPTLAKRLNECQEKLTRHRDDAEEYEGWTSVLRATVDRDVSMTLKLDHDDVRYFGLDREQVDAE